MVKWSGIEDVEAIPSRIWYVHERQSNTCVHCNLSYFFETFLSGFVVKRKLMNGNLSEKLIARRLMRAQVSHQIVI